MKKISLLLIILAGILIISCTGKKSEKAETDNALADSEFSCPVTYYLDILADSLDIEDFVIKKGDNLGSMLGRYNISSSRIDEISRTAKPIFDIRRFQLGKQYSVLCSTTTGEAEYLVYERSKRNHIVFDIRDSIRVYEYNKEITTKESSVCGVIESSLWTAIKKSGSDILLSDKMAEIYAWQIDFFGIGKGDNFKVIYDQAYIDDSVKVDIMDIKGAVFSHLGKDYYAIPFVQDSILEFFDEEGKSLRKAFLKAPLKYSRISSTFSHARKHPVLKIVRPHHGVDYAAPVGTPVRTIGDGTVIKRGYQAGGAGNYVKIKHNANYVTTYMHLSKFASGLKEGKRVSQGEVIGFVGSTGTSTGPHLDFRVHFNGKPINPLSMQSPPSHPVREELMDSFNIVKTQVINELDKIKLN